MKKEKQKRNSFRHLNQFDRDRIAALLDKGHTQAEASRILNIGESAVSRDVRSVKRKNGRYDATAAQRKADIKRCNSKYQGMKIEQNPLLRDRIISELKEHRSPDEIAGRLKLEKISPRVKTNAIYKWLYSSWGQAYCRYLCTRHYRRKKQKQLPKRQMIPNRVALEKRPLDGEHAEGDTFVSPTWKRPL